MTEASYHFWPWFVGEWALQLINVPSHVFSRFVLEVESHQEPDAVVGLHYRQGFDCLGVVFTPSEEIRGLDKRFPGVQGERLLKSKKWW